MRTVFTWWLICQNTESFSRNLFTGSSLFEFILFTVDTKEQIYRVNSKRKCHSFLWFIFFFLFKLIIYFSSGVSQSVCAAPHLKALLLPGHKPFHELCHTAAPLLSASSFPWPFCFRRHHHRRHYATTWCQWEERAWK
jgi:hypothetical protein